MEKRWRRVFAAELSKGEWRAIQKRATALPPPPVSAVNRERVEEAVSKALCPKHDHRAWARRILAGEKSTKWPSVSIEFAQEAMKKRNDG